MKSPQINNFCGFNLKYGTIIIGVVQSILSFMFLILSAGYAEHPNELIEMSDPSIVPEIRTLKALLIIISVFSGILCIASILIIFAAETNRPLLLLPWLICTPISVTVYILSTLVAIVNHTGNDNSIFILGHLVIGGIVTLFSSYNVIAVYSFYRHLKSLNF